MWRLTSLGVYFTGAGVNPARAMGPYVINSSFPDYFWIYYLGPVLGACVAAGLFHLLKIMGWQTANPDQDAGGVWGWGDAESMRWSVESSSGLGKEAA